MAARTNAGKAAHAKKRSVSGKRRSAHKGTPLPAVLFDLDGTLIDTVYEHVVTWSEILQDAGILLPAWKIHRHVGMSGKSFLRELFRELNPPPADLDLEALEQAHTKCFLGRAAHFQLLPGSQELLNHLSEVGVRWAIATTGQQDQTKVLLKGLRLPAGAPVITGDDVPKAKPSPDIFMLAAEQLGVRMNDSIVVGDSVWDMLAAGRKSALGVGLLCGGYGQEELERAGAFRVFADPADMLRRIEQLGIPGPS